LGECLLSAANLISAGIGLQTLAVRTFGCIGIGLGHFNAAIEVGVADMDIALREGDLLARQSCGRSRKTLLAAA
jgi:hypothetical protein